MYAAVLEELRKREKEMGIEPDWNVDALMKAETLEGFKTSIVTEFIIRMLGLGICSDTMVRKRNTAMQPMKGGARLWSHLLELDVYKKGQYSF